jgi:Leucine-rich repeat (LRR) protein/fibronectin type 3 domain-containing protein
MSNTASSKNTLFLLAFVSAIVFLIIGLPSVAFAADADVVSFPDANLKQALVDAGVDTSGDGNITQGEMAAVYNQMLDLGNKNISDLTGLQYAFRALYLDLSDNHITDLSVISTMSQLHILRIENNQIHSLSPLSGFEDMHQLKVSGNPLDNLNGVSSLTGLTELEANQTGIKDYSSLSMLGNLWYLFAQNNGITDMSGFANLIYLQEMDLSHNSISVFADLSPLTQLKYINLEHNAIQNIDAISSVPASLKQIYLSNNDISDIFAVSGCTHVIKFELGNNDITDLSALAGLTQLETLLLNNNKISNIEALEDLNNLRCLYLDHNSISDISVLSGKTALRTLTLGYNYIDISEGSAALNIIKSLSPTCEYLNYKPQTNDIIDNSDQFFINAMIGAGADLNNDQKISRYEMSQLSGDLDLNGKNIVDVSGIEDAADLKKLDLSGNYLDDMDYLKNLTALEELDVSDNYMDIASGSTALGDIQSLRAAGVQVSCEPQRNDLVAFDDPDLKALVIRYNADKNKDGDITRGEMANCPWGITIEDSDHITDLTGLEYAFSFIGVTVNCNISDLTPLSGLLSLKSINLSNADNQNVDFISNLKSLEILNINNVKLKNLNGIVSLKNLRELSIDGASLKDITPVGNLANLKTLSIYSMDVGLSPLKHLTKLESLSVWDSKINTIDWIAPLKELKTITIVHNDYGSCHLNSLNAFTSLKKLEEATLKQTGIKDIGGLNNLTALRKLDLTGNMVSNIASLANKKNLTDLNLDSNRLDTRESSAAMKIIRALQKQGTKVSYNQQNSTYEIMLSVSPQKYGTINDYTETQTTLAFSSGGETGFLATPKEGNYFKRWLLDGKPAGTDCNFYINLNGDHQVTAEFGRLTAPVAKIKPDGYWKIYLYWKPVEGVHWYCVYRATSPAGPYKKITDTPDPLYLDTKLKEGQTYYYKVRSAYFDYYNHATYSDDTPVLSAKPGLAQPEVTASPASINSIKLKWGYVGGMQYYKVYRAASQNGVFKYIGSTRNQSYVDKRLTLGRTYYYKVCAYSTRPVKCNGPLSAAVSAMPAPPAPTALKAIKLNNTTAKVSWGRVSGATKYEISRSDSKNGTYKMINSTASLYYINRSLNANAVYYYKVRAYHLERGKKIYGPFCTAVAPKKAPLAPVWIKAEKSGDSAVKVSWASVKDATKYELYRSESVNGKYKLIKTTALLSYTNSLLKKGKTYYYKVRAYHLEGKDKMYGSLSIIASRVL